MNEAARLVKTADGSIRRQIVAAMASNHGNVLLDADGRDATLAAPVRLERIDGLRLSGTAQAMDRRDTQHAGPGSTVFWCGQPGAAMIDARGCTNLVISDAALTGRADRLLAGRAGVGIWCRQPADAPTFGAGNWTVQRVSFYDMGVGLRFGEGEGDYNCADSVLESLHFGGCGAGVQVLHVQGVNYYARAWTAWGTAPLVQIVHGGHFYLDGAALTGCFRPDAPTFQFGPGGHNARASVLRNVRAEMGLGLDVGPYRHVLMDTVTMAEEWGPFVLKVRGSAVDVTGASLLRFDDQSMIDVDGDGAADPAWGDVRITGATLIGFDPRRHLKAGPCASISVKGCRDLANRPIPDFSLSN